eukprot:Clim_evm36s134 gene=Clim_evmTU36s134
MSDPLHRTTLCVWALLLIIFTSTNALASMETDKALSKQPEFLHQVSAQGYYVTYEVTLNCGSIQSLVLKGDGRVNVSTPIWHIPLQERLHFLNHIVPDKKSLPAATISAHGSGYRQLSTTDGGVDSAQQNGDNSGGSSSSIDSRSSHTVTSDAALVIAMNDEGAADLSVFERSFFCDSSSGDVYTEDEMIQIYLDGVVGKAHAEFTLAQTAKSRNHQLNRYPCELALCSLTPVTPAMKFDQTLTVKLDVVVDNSGVH